MGRERPRVLLIAEEANPEWVSVPLVGWSHARALADVADVHLVTQIRNRDAILNAGLVEDRDFTAIDSEKVAARMFKLASALRGGADRGWTMLQAFNTISYRYFERLVWRQFRPRLERGEFDLVHRLTPLSPAVPSPLAKKCAKLNIPFVLGPINGGVPWPKAFDAQRRKEKEWLSYVRDAHKVMPGYHSTRKHASAIFIASQITWHDMPKKYRAKCFYLPENAIDVTKFTARRSHQARLPIRAIFVGRIVPLKGLDMLLRAATSFIKHNQLQLQIIGDGPVKPDLEQLTDELEIKSGVDFTGWIPHAELQHHLARSDVFVFPSIREFGGGAVLEAMAVGLPSIVMNYGGPAELVSEMTGWKIEMGTPDTIISRLSAVLEAIVADPAELDRRSPRSVRRIEQHFTWEAKAAQVAQVYRWLLGHETVRPDFPMPIPDLADDNLLPSDLPDTPCITASEQ